MLCSGRRIVEVHQWWTRAQLSLACAGSVQVEAGSLGGWGGRVSPGRQQQPMLFYLGDEFVPSYAWAWGRVHMRLVGNASGGKELSLVSLVDFRAASSLD